MNNNESVTTFTTKEGRTLSMIGFAQYKYETENLTNSIVTFIKKDVFNNVYVAASYVKDKDGCIQTSGPFALGHTLDDAITHSLAALDWRRNRIPVAGGEHDLHVVSCEIDKDHTVYLYANRQDQKELYTAFLKKTATKDTLDFYQGSDVDSLFNCAYELVQKKAFGF